MTCKRRRGEEKEKKLLGSSQSKDLLGNDDVGKCFPRASFQQSSDAGERGIGSAEQEIQGAWAWLLRYIKRLQPLDNFVRRAIIFRSVCV